MVNALASAAKGPGFDPCDRRGKFSVFEHAFAGITLNKYAVDVN